MLREFWITIIIIISVLECQISLNLIICPFFLILHLLPIDEHVRNIGPDNKTLQPCRKYSQVEEEALLPGSKPAMHIAQVEMIEKPSPGSSVQLQLTGKVNTYAKVPGFHPAFTM